MSHLQIIAELETVTEMQARVIKIMATRLAELGDTVTGRDARLRRPTRRTATP